MRRLYRLGLVDAVVAKLLVRRFELRSRVRQACSLAVVALCLTMGSACARDDTTATPTVPALQVKTARLEGRPFEEMLPKLDPAQRSRLLAFTTTVPEPLPELAYPSSVFLKPTSPSDKGSQVLELSDGYAEVQVVMANPGSNTNQPNVICLRNATQVSCTPQVDVWEVSLSPETLAFVPTRIPASPGDRLTFLLMANDEPKRVDPASQVLWAFVEERPGLPSEFIDAPIHEKVLGGCNFATLVTDISRSTFRRPGTQQLGTVLYLLLQLCEPIGREYMHLVPIVDRTRVIDLPGEVWHSSIRLTDVASVIPINTAKLGPAHEFQVAVVPLSDEAASALSIRFTHAVAFSD